MEIFTPPNSEEKNADYRKIKDHNADYEVKGAVLGPYLLCRLKSEIKRERKSTVSAPLPPQPLTLLHKQHLSWSDAFLKGVYPKRSG